jgi:predicted DNA-binding transcriptional regulator AlpA
MTTLIKFEPQERFLRAKDLRARYGIADATIYRWVDSGKLPEPEHLNGIRVWRESTIAAAEAKLLSSDERVATRLQA